MADQKKKDPPPPSRLPQLPPFDPGAWLVGTHAEARRPVTRKGKPVPATSGTPIPPSLIGKVATPAAPTASQVDPRALALVTALVPEAGAPAGALVDLLLKNWQGSTGRAQVGDAGNGTEEDPFAVAASQYGAQPEEDPFAVAARTRFGATAETPATPFAGLLERYGGEPATDPFDGLAAKYAGGPVSSAAPVAGAPSPPVPVQVAANPAEQPSAVPFGGLIKRYGGEPGSNAAPAAPAPVSVAPRKPAAPVDPFAAAAAKFYQPGPLTPRDQLPQVPRPAGEVIQSLPQPQPVDTALQGIQDRLKPQLEGRPGVQFGPLSVPSGPIADRLLSAQSQGREAVAGGATALGKIVSVIDRPRATVAAFLNTVVRDSPDPDAYRARVAQLQQKLGRAPTAEEAVDADLRLLGEAIGNGLDAAGREWKDYTGAPLSGVTGAMIPFLKDIRVMKPVEGLQRALTPITLIEGVEMAMRSMGFKSAADQLGATTARMDALHGKALKDYTVPLDRVGDFVLDFVIDPLNVLTEGIGAGKMYLHERRISPGNRAFQVLDDLTPEQAGNFVRRFWSGERIAQPVEWAVRQARTVYANRKAGNIIRDGETLLYRDLVQIEEQIGALRDLQRLGAGHAAVGPERAAVLDDYLFHYMDAGSNTAQFKTGGEVAAAMNRAGYPPQIIDQIVAIGERAKDIDQEFGRRLVRFGILSQDAFQALRGKHIRYLYSHGAYNADDIGQTVASWVAHRKMIDKNLAAGRNADLTREMQVELGLQTKASLGFGQGATSAAKSANVANTLDQLEAAGLVRRDPGRVDAIERIADDKIAGYVPASRTVDPKTGKSVQDFAGIGDSVKFNHPVSGERTAGVVEDIRLDPEGRVAFVRIGEDVFKTETLRGAELEKIRGPLRLSESTVLPAELSPVQARMELIAKQKAAGQDLVAEAKSRIPGVESEIRQLRAYIAQLDNNEVIQVAGKSSEALRSKARVDLRHNEAVLRRLRSIATGGKADRRGLDVVDQEIRAGIKEYRSLEKARDTERQRLSRIDPASGELTPSRIDWEKNSKALNVQLAKVETRVSKLEAAKPTDPAKLNEWRLKMDKAKKSAIGIKNKIAWYESHSPLGRIPKYEAQMGEIEKRLYDLRNEREILAEVSGVSQLEATRSAEAARLDTLTAERGTLDAKLKGTGKDTPEAAQIRQQIQALDAKINREKAKQIPSAAFRSEMTRLAEEKEGLEWQLAAIPDGAPGSEALLARVQAIDARLAETKKKMLAAQLGEVTAATPTNVIEQGQEIVSRKVAEGGSPEQWAQDGWVQVSGAKWGQWDGAWMPKGVAQMLEKSTTPQQLSDLQRIAQRGVAVVKYVKAPMNPAVHFTNIVGNTVLAEVGAQLHDISLLNHPELFTQAAEEIFTGTGADLKELNRISTVFRNSSDALDAINEGAQSITRAFTVEELAGRTAGQKVLDGARAAVRAPGELFAKEEQLFKLALYKAFRHKAGMPAEQAAKLVQRYLFDYSDVPQLVEVVRKYGIIPFATFPYKASGILFETLANKPHLLNRFNILRGQAFENVEGAREQFPDLAEYVKENAPFLIPVGKTDKGDVTYLDASRLLPFGYVGDLSNFTPEGILSNSFVGGLPTGAALRSGIPGISEGFNSNPALGNRDELREGMSPKEKVAIQKRNIAQTYAPWFVPPASSFERLRRGFTGGTVDSSRYSAEQSAVAAITQSLFGLATYIRQGAQVPGRAEASKQRADAAAPELQAALREAVVAHNELIKGGGRVPRYPQLEQTSNLARLQAMNSAAENNLKHILTDGTIPLAQKREKFSNTIRWMLSINERAARVIREEKERPAQ